MLIETTNNENIKIIKISGEVDFENYKEFGVGLLKAIEGVEDVLLDLSGVNYLNSMGLSFIVKAYSNTRKGKRDFRMCGLKDHIRKLFSITKLDKMIGIYEDQEKALEEFI